MDDIEKEINELHAEKQEEEDSNEVELFKKAKHKKKSSDKLFSDISKILDDDDEDGDSSMFMALTFKDKKKHKDHEIDGDLFDTKDKGDKKIKSIETKFKPEMLDLKKLLKDNEITVKNIKDFLEPFVTSKARGSSKIVSDLFAALNSANNNRLSTLKELSNIKKTVLELKYKLKKDENDEIMPADQYGSKLFAQLFSQGRNNVINESKEFQPDLSDYVNSDKSFDEICDERLSTEKSSYRSDDGNKMIQYEARHPKVCVLKNSLNGNIRLAAIDDKGIEIEDYPVPDLESLGTIHFNNENGTAMDNTGRVYKVIEDNVDSDEFDGLDMTMPDAENQ